MTSIGILSTAESIVVAFSSQYSSSSTLFRRKLSTATYFKRITPVLLELNYDTEYVHMYMLISRDQKLLLAIIN